MHRYVYAWSLDKISHSITGIGNTNCCNLLARVYLCKSRVNLALVAVAALALCSDWLILAVGIISVSYDWPEIED